MRKTMLAAAHCKFQQIVIQFVRVVFNLKTESNGENKEGWLLVVFARSGKDRSMRWRPGAGVSAKRRQRRQILLVMKRRKCRLPGKTYLNLCGRLCAPWRPPQSSGNSAQPSVGGDSSGASTSATRETATDESSAPLTRNDIYPNLFSKWNMPCHQGHRIRVAYNQISPFILHG